ncbi:MAG: beta-ketoacyl-[acyl-carrier-protein] synthase family protein, partial [Nitrospinae bacterium]|nr:beta-ketoacyl-[acyl-carrier-protein] synthase family protein [Nitrospinota bacterium]
MARQQRVVITGLGAIAPNGLGKDAFWEGLIRGRSGITRITRFDASAFPCQIAGEVADFQPTSYIDRQEAKRMPRVSQFAVAAAKMALEDSGLRVTPENARKIGVCFGTSAGKGEIFETDHLPFLERGVRGIHPLSFVEFTPHGTSSHVAMELGASGVCGAVSTGCTAGLEALQWGYLQLCLGRATAMVVGSAEALLSPFAFGAVCAGGVLSKRNEVPQEASRPFELHRDGLVLGEGAGAAVMEVLEQAENRHARIYAEILGYATARDGTDLVRCDLSGSDMARVIEAALYQARLPKQRIDYINAHGIGLRDYDTAETNAIKAVFGDQVYNIPVSSIKSMIGQPFAAASSLQVVASCLTLQHGVIPPTINYDTPDPDCDLDYVPNHAR